MVGLVLCALVGATPAHAALKFRSCNDLAFKCARLTVPLDRTGRVPGTVSLLVKRSRARAKHPRGVVVAFAGGPGQSATAAYAGDSLGPLGQLLKDRDLIVFDQRGTGRSGLLRCKPLEHANILHAGAAAAACAASLGPRRAFYTSRDTAEDLEAIRTQLGVPALSLYGVSYGTRTALSYAQRYPSHVDRMVLDSVVKPDGPDALNTDTFAAVPRVLRALCGRRGCRGITRDPVSDVARLTARHRRARSRCAPAWSARAGRRARVGSAATTSTARWWPETSSPSCGASTRPRWSAPCTGTPRRCCGSSAGRSRWRAPPRTRAS